MPVIVEEWQTYTAHISGDVNEGDGEPSLFDRSSRAQTAVS